MNTIRVSGCAIVQEGKLLLRFRKRDSCYEFPGGVVEECETLVQAALREVKEEVGCSVVITRDNAGYAAVRKQGILLRLYVHGARLAPGQMPREMEPHEFGELLWMLIVDFTKYPLASNVITFCCKEYLNAALKRTLRGAIS